MRFKHPITIKVHEEDQNTMNLLFRTMNDFTDAVTDVGEVLEENYSDEFIYELEYFITKSTVTTGKVSEGFDASLLDEIGKAYRKMYDTHEDENKKQQALGAMYAVAKIKEMM